MSAAYPLPATVDGWQRAQRYARHLWNIASAPRQKLLRDAGLSKAQGLRELHEKLLIPMRDSLGELWAVQEMPVTYRPGRPWPCLGRGPALLLGARLDGLRYAVGAVTDDDHAGRVVGVTTHVHDALCWNDECGVPVLAAFAPENVATLAAELRFAYPTAHVVLWERWGEQELLIRDAAARTGARAMIGSEGIDLLGAAP